MRTLFLGLPGLLLVSAAVGCSSSATSAGASLEVPGGTAPTTGGGGPTGSTPGTGATDTASGTPASGAGTGGGSSGATGSGSSAIGDAAVFVPTPAGVLTAGMWDDSLNYDFFSGYLAGRTSIPGDPGFAIADYDASHAEFATRTPHTSIDAALVIDTTGSMTDELSYLTAEFAHITTAIATAFPGAEQRWALVVYRDTPDTDPGDAYVVKSYDFTASVSDFAATVSAQSAANGGDYPESPELGLEELQKLTWRSDASVAKVAFWVADAPHHAAKAPAMKQAIVDTHAAGIHVYPVSGSGTDDLLELSMRTTAEITGGRYLFLTDDSGIGGPHKTPEIPCYFVTKLASDLVRAVSMELTATYLGPDAAEIIRTVGDPSSAGLCPVQDGGTVTIF